ncbi:MAG: choice-of-anchor Q domain-containing protein, partial [Chloroflexota bacterium]
AIWASLTLVSMTGQAAPAIPNAPDILISGPNYDPARQTICPAGCDFDSVSAAVAAASPSTPAVYSILGLELAESQISIDQGKNITIIGQGASRTKIGVGVDDGRIFSVSDGASVTLRDLSIVGGSVPTGNGGGLLISGAGTSVTVQFVDMRDGSAQNGGGAAVINGASLVVEDSSIQSNTAADAGGGIFVQNGTLSTKRTLIYENKAAVGGGLAYASDNGTGLIENVTFGKNVAQAGANTQTAKRGGGAIYIEHVAGGSQLSTLDIQFTTVGQNSTPDGEGGGIYLEDGTVNFLASVLFDNMANSAVANCQQNSGTTGSQGYNVSTDGSCALTEPSDFVSSSLSFGNIADNGGFSHTFEIDSSSHAIGSVLVSSGLCPDVDQRNIERRSDSTCDAGAYEAEKFVTFCNAAGAIPDNDLDGLTNVLTINESFAIYDLAVLMRLSNETDFIDDLSATLTFQDGTPHVVDLISMPTIDQSANCNTSGPTTSQLRFSDSQTDQLTGSVCFEGANQNAGYQPLSSAGTLNDLVGQTLDQASWQIEAIDSAAGATGTVENWCVQAKIKPDVYEVTRADDPVPDGCKAGDCSLREAISDAMKAPGRELINVSVAGPIVLTQIGSGEQEAIGNPDINDLDITEDVRIVGSITDLVTIDASGINDRIFDVFPGAKFELSGFELKNGRVTSGSRGGAAILNRGKFEGEHLLVTANVTENQFGYGAGIQSTSGSDFTLRYSEVISNSAAYEDGDGNVTGSFGGIYNWNSMMELVGVTIAGSSGNGSAVFNNAAGGDAVLVMRSVTLAASEGSVAYGFSNNWQDTLSSPEHPEAAIAYLNNSVIGDHNSSSCSVALPNGNSTASLISLGFNMAADDTCVLTAGSDSPSTDPMLTLFVDPDDGRIVLKPDPFSPLYNSGDVNNCPMIDSLGTQRPQNGRCDIGAVELSMAEAVRQIFLPTVVR